MSVVLYEKKGRIVYITLNRPDKLNAMNDEMVDGLQKAWVDFRDDDDLWVAILAANGKAFCAGADITGRRPTEAAPVRPGPPPNVIRATSRSLQAAPTSFEVWKPVICAVHGYVYGAGAWLALNCDIRVATEDTKFGIPEVRFGRGVNFSPLITQYIPIGIANELLLWGDPIDAERAYNLGIFNRVVTKEELMPTATKLAERVCENAPLAVRTIKEVMRRGGEVFSFEGKMVLAEIMFPRVVTSEDYKEGVNAFKEKRKPIWKGK